MYGFADSPRGSQFHAERDEFLPDFAIHGEPEFLRLPVFSVDFVEGQAFVAGGEDMFIPREQLSDDRFGFRAGHALRSGGFSAHEAARVLRRSEADIALAADTLRRLGLTERPEAPLKSRELPALSAHDLRDVAAKDRAFQGLVSEAETALGRVLSDNDLRSVASMAMALRVYSSSTLP